MSSLSIAPRVATTPIAAAGEFFDPEAQQDETEPAPAAGETEK